MITREKISEAIAGSEIIKIIYHGGSQPGTAREISPIKINGDKVRARCYAANAVKVFSLEKMELIDLDDNTIPTWQAGRKAKAAYQQINDVLTKHEEQLLSWGWVVESSPDCISLHRRFKNGKVRKGSDLSLDHTEYDYLIDVGDNGEAIEVPVKKARPWSVYGKAGGSYKHLDRAAAKFLELAAMYAPDKRA